MRGLLASSVAIGMMVVPLITGNAKTFAEPLPEKEVKVQALYDSTQLNSYMPKTKNNNEKAETKDNKGNSDSLISQLDDTRNINGYYGVFYGPSVVLEARSKGITEGVEAGAAAEIMPTAETTEFDLKSSEDWAGILPEEVEAGAAAGITPQPSSELERPVTLLEIPASLPVVSPMVVPYGEDGQPLKSGALRLESSALSGEQPVSMSMSQVGLVNQGVSSEMIEKSTFLTVDRLDSMVNGGVMVTYSTPFRPEEVLTINSNNMPTLMMMDRSGNLIPHPTRTAAVHKNEILLIDNNINLRDLQDNPFPTSTFNEQIMINSLDAFMSQQEVSFVPSITNRPISSQDFQRPLPAVSMTVASVLQTPQGGEWIVSYDEAGNPVMIEAGMPLDGRILEMPGEIPVAFTSSLPVGWRGVIVGDALLILDERGVIQGIVPAIGTEPSIIR